MNTTYSKLEQQDEASHLAETDATKGEPKLQGSRQYRSPLSMLLIGVLIGVASSLLAGGFAIWLFSSLSKTSTSQQQQVCMSRDVRYDCGNSTAQAKAKGCHFDLLTLSWVPWQCANRELEQEFLEQE